MHIKKNQSLKAYNTFGLSSKAAALAEVRSVEELRAALQAGIQPLFVLGGGSNLLLTKDLPGLVILNRIQEKRILREYTRCVHVAIGGGENWHEVVLWSIRKGLGGIENLSLIPGTMGAAPIQNIGAYGVELKDVFVRLEAIDLKSGERHIFKKSDCVFGYRDSVFKRQHKGRFCISRVILRLQKPKHHQLNLQYGAIRDTLKAMKVRKVGIKQVSQAVIQIRSSKLPDPAKLGNSGSFFKNPELSKRAFNRLHKAYPQVPHYPLADGRVKVPAGWLIEQCGWKGKRVGQTGSHARQALVLVNYGKAKGAEIWALAQAIMASVKERFGIVLRAEVNVI